MADERKVVKKIIAGDVRANLTDALTDAFHVLGGDPERLNELLADAMMSARLHYQAEARGEDGVVVEVEA